MTSKPLPEPQSKGPDDASKDGSESTKRHWCEYTCEAGEAARLDLSESRSLHIVLTDVNTLSSWTLPLHYINQRLRGHVSPDQREIELRFADGDEEPSKSFPNHDHDFVDRIDFSYVDGRGQHLKQRVDFSRLSKREKEEAAKDPEAALYLRVPGAGCRDDISFRYHGSRAFREDYAQISSGQLVLQPPTTGRRGRRLYLFLHAAPVLQIHTSKSLRLSNDNGFLSWGGEFEGGLAHWPLWRHKKAETAEKAQDTNSDASESTDTKARERDSSLARGWRFEYRVGLMINSVYVHPLSAEPGEPAPEHRKVPYLRYQIGFGFQSPWLGDWVSLGAGLHGVWGRAVRQSEAVNFFDQRYSNFDFALRPMVDARARLPFVPQSSLWRRLEGFFRFSGIVLEDAPLVTTDLRGDPELDLREYKTAWVTLSLGIGMSF